MGSISFETFLCGDVCCLIKNDAQRPAGIRETGLFSVLYKILVPSKKVYLKTKHTFFFFFLLFCGVLSLFFC